MEILRYPNAVLTTKCPPYNREEFAKDLELADLLRSMVMNNKCLGLAANQMGIQKRFIVMREGKNHITCFDPRFVGIPPVIETAKEGTMSMPGLIVPVPRWRSIEAMYFNKKGRPVGIVMVGLKARVFQHLVDQLNGQMIIKTESEVEKI